MSLSIDELKNAFEIIPETNTTRALFFHIESWKVLRKHGVSYAQWTDNELESFIRPTGYIGTKCGVMCYVHFNLYGQLVDEKKLNEKRLKPGTKGSVCYSCIPGYWSPCFEDAVVVHVFSHQIIKVKTLETNKEMIVIEGNFQPYKNQENVRQLTFNY